MLTPNKQKAEMANGWIEFLTPVIDLFSWVKLYSIYVSEVQGLVLYMLAHWRGFLGHVMEQSH